MKFPQGKPGGFTAYSGRPRGQRTEFARVSNFNFLNKAVKLSGLRPCASLAMAGTGHSRFLLGFLSPFCEFGSLEW